MWRRWNKDKRRNEAASIGSGVSAVLGKYMYDVLALASRVSITQFSMQVIQSGEQRVEVYTTPDELPMPAFELDMESKAVGRSFSDWLSFIGGSYANGVGGEGASLTSWTRSPLIAVRMLQDPGAYASTLTR